MSASWQSKFPHPTPDPNQELGLVLDLTKVSAKSGLSDFQLCPYWSQRRESGCRADYLLTDKLHCASLYSSWLAGREINRCSIPG